VDPSAFLLRFSGGLDDFQYMEGVFRVDERLLDIADMDKICGHHTKCIGLQTLLSRFHGLLQGDTYI